eukprot:4009073-Prymnesium_polylepis.2
MRAMQVTANAPPDAYNDAAKLSMNAKIDPAGEMKLQFVKNKLNAFRSNDLDRMDSEDVDSDFLAARGLRLVFPRNADEVVKGISAAPLRSDEGPPRVARRGRERGGPASAPARHPLPPGRPRDAHKRLFARQP